MRVRNSTGPMACNAARAALRSTRGTGTISRHGSPCSVIVTLPRPAMTGRTTFVVFRRSSVSVAFTITKMHTFHTKASAYERDHRLRCAALGVAVDFHSRASVFQRIPDARSCRHFRALGMYARSDVLSPSLGRALVARLECKVDWIVWMNCDRGAYVPLALAHSS